MECKADNCSNETGSDRKQTCCDKCRKALSRSVTKECDGFTVTTFTPDEIKQMDEFEDRVRSDASVVAVVDQHSKHTVTRTNPDTLNTGKPMAAHQLKQAGLKANRVPIPGDHDYKGVCVKVDGVWKVRAA